MAQMRPRRVGSVGVEGSTADALDDTEATLTFRFGALGFLLRGRLLVDHPADEEVGEQHDEKQGSESIDADFG